MPDFHGVRAMAAMIVNANRAASRRRCVREALVTSRVLAEPMENLNDTRDRIYGRPHVRMNLMAIGRMQYLSLVPQFCHY